MTVNQLFKTVLSLMFCPLKDGDEYKEAFLNILNMKLAECFMINNALREFKEKDALKSAQRVEDFSSMLEYEDEIINALPYGISAILLVDDDTTGMANVYRRLLQSF